MARKTIYCQKQVSQQNKQRHKTLWRTQISKRGWCQHLQTQEKGSKRWEVQASPWRSSLRNLNITNKTRICVSCSKILIYRLTSVLDEYKEELVNERRKRDLLEKENKKYKKLRERLNLQPFERRYLPFNEYHMSRITSNNYIEPDFHSIEE